jgi:preprotein translocase subunit SecA
MIARIKEEALAVMFRVQMMAPEQIEAIQKPKEQPLVFSHGGEGVKKKPVKRADTKVGRNSPCPCGSGKKYKICCGK